MLIITNDEKEGREEDGEEEEGSSDNNDGDKNDGEEEEEEDGEEEEVIVITMVVIMTAKTQGFLRSSLHLPIKQYPGECRVCYGLRSHERACFKNRIHSW